MLGKDNGFTFRLIGFEGEDLAQYTSPKGIEVGRLLRLHMFQEGRTYTRNDGALMQPIQFVCNDVRLAAPYDQYDLSDEDLTWLHETEYDDTGEFFGMPAVSPEGVTPAIASGDTAPSLISGPLYVSFDEATQIAKLYQCSDAESAAWVWAHEIFMSEGFLESYAEVATMPDLFYT